MNKYSSADILSRLCKAGNIKTDSALAKILNVSPQSVYDAKKKNRVPASWAITIAERFGVTVDWLLFGRGAMHAMMFSHSQHISRERYPISIPVIGLDHSDTSDWFELRELALSTTLGPASHDAMVFALPVVDYRLFPIGIKPGHVLVFDSLTKPRSEDLVFAQKKNGTASIRLLKHKNDHNLTLAAWTDPDERGKQELQLETLDLTELDMLATAVVIKIKG